MTAPATPLDLIGAVLDRPAGAAARAMAAHLAAQPGVLAVVFYGNLLRDPAAGGLLDLYVLTAGDAAYHGRGLSALANRLLPPNVYFVEIVVDGAPVQAKVAVMRLAVFRHRMRRRSWDTTLWARFAQPSALLHAQDGAARNEVIAAIGDAFGTASWWAARLAPADADACGCWEALFRHTYGAELRVEGAGRSTAIVGADPQLYAALHAALIAPSNVTEQDRMAARRAWWQRRWAGKVLNAARLAKAAFTFRGGIAYALAKVERHSGRPVELSPWQRRLPWLAAPFVMLRLLFERRLR